MNLPHLQHFHVYNYFNATFNVFNTIFCPSVRQLNHADGHTQIHKISPVPTLSYRERRDLVKAFHLLYRV